MKIIPLSEAKAHLSRYGRLCHDEPIIVTVNGVPSFQLVPLGDDDDVIDRLLEYHPGFRQLLQERLHQKSSPARRPHDGCDEGGGSSWHAFPFAPSTRRFSAEVR